MSCYVSSNANRLYAGLESGFGVVPAPVTADRFAAVKLTARQRSAQAERRDKTGSRTFPGTPAGQRRKTTFELQAYLTGWGGGAQRPGYAPLIQAAMGGAPLHYAGGVTGPGSTATQLAFSAVHGLVSGQAVTYQGELRFVAAVVDATKVQVNAPFSTVPAAGAPIGATLTYFPATELPSVSLFDYWSPATAVQRIVCGASVDKMTIKVNGDYHEFEFSGPAQDLIDSSSFSSGIGSLSAFPAEPAVQQLNAQAVPGHLGQAWLGSASDRFLTITSALFTLANNLDARANEFGSSMPQCMMPGKREVGVDFDLYQNDEAATVGLYQAARQESPVPVMFQLGQQTGQMFGVYLKSVVPEVPDFDDSDPRLQWRFRNSRAQGTVDDEIAVAFG